MTEFDHENARSVPENTGRSGRYETVMQGWRQDLQRPLVSWAGSRKFIDTHDTRKMVYAFIMGRTNIVLDDELVRKARKLTRLKTKREIVGKALELLVRSESRKGILHYYGSGIWKGDLKRMRRNRA